MAAARKLGFGALFGLAWYLALLAAPSSREVMSGETWYPWPVMLAIITVTSAQLSVLVPSLAGDRGRWLSALLLGPCFTAVGAVLVAETVFLAFLALDFPGALRSGELLTLIFFAVLGQLGVLTIAAVTVFQALPWALGLSTVHVAVVSMGRRVG